MIAPSEQEKEKQLADCIANDPGQDWTTAFVADLGDWTNPLASCG